MKAPCGHDGVPVFGHFVNCLTPGCDGTVGERCGRCQSRDVRPFEAVGLPEGTKHCRKCGKCWSPGF